MEVSIAASGCSAGCFDPDYLEQNLSKMKSIRGYASPTVA